MVSVSQESEATRDRLLHAAGEEFARVGFRSASVRAICEAAGADVSAVTGFPLRKKRVRMGVTCRGTRARFGRCPLDAA